MLSRVTRDDMAQGGVTEDKWERVALPNYGLAFRSLPLFEVITQIPNEDV